MVNVRRVEEEDRYDGSRPVFNCGSRQSVHHSTDSRHVLWWKRTRKIRDTVPRGWESDV